MSRPLEGRHAIITGGNRGIGLAIADALAAQGARLSLIGRDQERLADSRTRLADAHGTQVDSFVADVSDEHTITGALHAATDRNGAPYILVNNAGQAEGATLEETTRALWDRMLAVNLTGTYLCSRVIAPAMVSAGEGRIVNVASTAGLRGYARVSAYSAAKHGVIGFTRALAMELARTGVTVNAVCPSYADTEMTARTVTAVAARLNTSADDARTRIARSIPMGRLIQPEEVAAAVLYLCSPAAAAVTGQALAVDGGETQ